jgi:hypothetical protein
MTEVVPEPAVPAGLEAFFTTDAPMEAAVTAEPVAPLVILKSVALAKVIVAAVILKAGVDKPEIVTTWPTEKEFAAV